VDHALARLDAIAASERARRAGRRDVRAAALADACRRGGADLRGWGAR